MNSRIKSSHSKPLKEREREREREKVIGKLIP